MKSNTSVSFAFNKQKVSKPLNFSELKKFCLTASLSSVTSFPPETDRVTSFPVDILSFPPELGVVSSGGDVSMTFGVIARALPFEMEP